MARTGEGGSHPPKILALAGSLRRDSQNKKLVRIAAAGAREAGAEVTYLDLKDFPLPVYDGDLEEEQGIPENAVRLKDLFRAHDGLLISSPEYNSSISGAFKNVIDWLSRSAPGEPPLVAFDGKVAVLMSASPGRLGGLRGLVTVRSILGNIRVLVLPEQLAVANAPEAFDAEGQLRDSVQAKAVRELGERLVEVVRRLKAEG